MPVKKVAIFTSAYPYYPGEQFFEQEARAWAEYGRAVKVDLFPGVASGVARKVPDGLNVDNGLSFGSKRMRFFMMLVALSSPLFWRELLAAKIHRKSVKLAFWQATDILKSISILYVFILKVKLKTRLRGYDVAYFYWSDGRSLAGTFLKRVGFARKVVSRAHGADLYEERQKGGYMPLKRRYKDAYDELYLLSRQGRDYALRKYGFSASRLKVSALGVKVPDIITRKSKSEFHILSVSFCVPVKRLDRIIDAVASVALARPASRFRWTHIGGGVLQQALEERCKKAFSQCANLRYELAGTKSNAEIRAFYEMVTIDLFLNTSESEGMPVAVMEAMSYGVPVVAPDVGGISGMVDHTVGLLLNAPSSEEAVAAAVIHIHDIFFLPDYENLKNNARKRAEALFNAERNYQTFIGEILGSNKQ